jgi:acyl transferase domain-containing protein
MDSAESFCSAGRLSRPALNGIYQSTSQVPDPQLLVFSASHEASLRRSVENYGQYILKNPSSLADLAYTLGSRREHLMHRAFCITDGKHRPEVSRLAKVSRDNPQLVFVFTGQGAQWPRMGAELLNDFPVVRESFAKMEYTLANLPSPCPWSLREELLKPAKDSLVPNATYSQPLCTALQCALVDLLRSFGICPQAVVGHSSGEIAAAYASGALSLHDAIIVAYQRGMCSSKIKKSGAMAALGLGRKEVERFLRPGVGLACENSPESTTISGDAETVDLVMATIKSARPETFVRRLQVDKAYHSRKLLSCDLYRSWKLTVV